MDAKTAEELVRRMAAALRGTELYAPTHPLVQRRIDELTATITCALQASPTVVVGFIGDEVVVDRTRLPRGSASVVGFARALVVRPNILLMDEAFSALDVLTAETLRNDFLDLWDFVPLIHRELSAVCPNLLVLPACERHLLHASAIATLAQEVDLLFGPRLNDLFDALVDGAKHRLVAGQAVGTLTHVPGFCTCSNLAWRWRTPLH